MNSQNLSFKDIFKLTSHRRNARQLESTIRREESIHKRRGPEASLKWQPLKKQVKYIYDFNFNS